jgi:hypothetical protein
MEEIVDVTPTQSNKAPVKAGSSIASKAAQSSARKAMSEQILGLSRLC